MRQRMHSWSQKGITRLVDIMCQKITQVSTVISRSQETSWVPHIPTLWEAANHTTDGNLNDRGNQ
eukprot:5385083-Ditylum_brightwellii.AAC.1